MKILIFIKAYIKSMRLYYSFVTGLVGWVGIALAEYVLAESHSSSDMSQLFYEKIVALLILFSAWGINQIVNDYLGLAEDRINAPDRPMVTGELNPVAALGLSLVLTIIIALTVIVYLNPIALVPLALGVGLNIVYEYAKGYGIWGNIVFGLMISSAYVFGFLALAKLGHINVLFFSVLLILVVLNGLLTYYTYFKDAEGDKAADKRTLVVIFGMRRAKVIAFAVSFLPLITFGLLYYAGGLPIDFSLHFIGLGVLATFLIFQNGYYFSTIKKRSKAYFGLRYNFQAYTCSFCALIALFQPELGLWLFLLAYVFVGFLFGLHKKATQ